MKKFVSVLGILVLLSVNSFAFTSSYSKGNEGDGEILLGTQDKAVVVLSADVQAKYGYVTNAGDDYAASTYASKGRGRVFASGSWVGNIYYKNGKSLSDPPDFKEGTVDYSGWTRE